LDFEARADCDLVCWGAGCCGEARGWAVAQEVVGQHCFELFMGSWSVVWKVMIGSAIAIYERRTLIYCRFVSGNQPFPEIEKGTKHCI